VSRNITDTLTDVLADVSERGSLVVARGQEQREVLSTLVQIDRPTERVLAIPKRNNNISASPHRSTRTSGRPRRYPPEPTRGGPTCIAPQPHGGGCSATPAG
jgi:hypothetical protein